MIVFAVYSVSQIRILEEFARRLPKEQTYLFFSFNDTEGVNHQLRQSAGKLNTRLEVLQELGLKIQKSTLKNLVRKFEPNPQFRKLAVNQTYRELLLKQAVACEQLLEQNNVDIVVVCEDGPGGCAPLIAAAKRRNILVVEMPFGIGEMRDYENYIDNNAQKNTLNLVPENQTGAVLRELAPHWIKQTPYGDITLLPAEFILARLATGMDLPEPWVVHGGEADVLLVESEAMERIYKREHVPDGKRIMTGSCYADVVYDELAGNPALKAAYETSSLIDVDRPRILIALPPSYHNECAQKPEFATYRETIEKLLVGCREAHPNAQVTVSLHPAVQADTLKVINELADEVSEEWLLRLIPRHDVFVSVFSSTIRWALMCRKPIINYDMYQFDLPTYDTADCVFTTPVLQVALTKLQAILASSEAYHAAAQQVKSCSHEWGIMDGHNYDRIWDILQKHKKTTGSQTWFRWLNLFNMRSSALSRS
ncbi:MAG: hypothetical protein K0Q50_782 [Vampirovibrio sp.]|jgi:hypothetical protein|nr:hypothetical protein [Vampirovibrio sp.]